MRVDLHDDDIIDLADEIKDRYFQNFLRMFAYDFWGPSVKKLWIKIDNLGRICDAEGYDETGMLKPDQYTSYMNRVFEGANRSDGFEMISLFNNAFQQRLMRLPRPHRTLPPSGAMMYDLNCEIHRQIVGQVYAEVYVEGE